MHLSLGLPLLAPIAQVARRLGLSFWHVAEFLGNHATDGGRRLRFVPPRSSAHPPSALPPPGSASRGRYGLQAWWRRDLRWYEPPCRYRPPPLCMSAALVASARRQALQIITPHSGRDFEGPLGRPSGCAELPFQRARGGSCQRWMRRPRCSAGRAVVPSPCSALDTVLAIIAAASLCRLVLGMARGRSWSSWLWTGYALRHSRAAAPSFTDMTVTGGDGFDDNLSDLGVALHSRLGSYIGGRSCD